MNEETAATIENETANELNVEEAANSSNAKQTQETSKVTLNAIERIREYARGFGDSIKRFIKTQREQVSKAFQVFVSFVMLFVQVIWCGSKVTLREFFYIIAAFGRRLFDFASLPAEKLVIPLFDFFLNHNTKWYNRVGTNDGIAFGCYLMILFIGLPLAIVIFIIISPILEPAIANIWQSLAHPIIFNFLALLVSSGIALLVLTYGNRNTTALRRRILVHAAWLVPWISTIIVAFWRLPFYINVFIA